MTHPKATNGAVANPKPSAPSNAAIATSLPDISFPSASSITLLLKLLATNVCWASAKPNSQGTPAFWIDVLGAAPVPPS